MFNSIAELIYTAEANGLKPKLFHLSLSAMEKLNSIIDTGFTIREKRRTGEPNQLFGVPFVVDDSTDWIALDTEPE